MFVLELAVIAKCPNFNSRKQYAATISHGQSGGKFLTETCFLIKGHLPVQKLTCLILIKYLQGHNTRSKGPSQKVMFHHTKGGKNRHL